MRVVVRALCGVAVATFLVGLASVPVFAAPKDHVTIHIGSPDERVTVSHQPPGSPPVNVTVTRTPDSLTVQVDTMGVTVEVIVNVVPHGRRPRQQPLPEQQPPAQQAPPPASAGPAAAGTAALDGQLASAPLSA